MELGLPRLRSYRDRGNWKIYTLVLIIVIVLLILGYWMTGSFGLLIEPITRLHDVV